MQRPNDAASSGIYKQLDVPENGLPSFLVADQVAWIEEHEITAHKAAEDGDPQEAKRLAGRIRKRLAEGRYAADHAWLRDRLEFFEKLIEWVAPERQKLDQLAAERYRCHWAAMVDGDLDAQYELPHAMEAVEAQEERLSEAEDAAVSWFPDPRRQPAIREQHQGRDHVTRRRVGAPQGRSRSPRGCNARSRGSRRITSAGGGGSGDDPPDGEADHHLLGADGGWR